MRDCKGIKILLAIYPSSREGEDFLPQPKVFWNLRLSCVSSLLSLFLLSWFSRGCWAFCRFPCAGFSSHSSSTVGAFAELGFCCACPPLYRGQAEVVSATLSLRNGTIDVGGVCNFLGSVSPQHKVEAMDWLVLQLSFIWQVKENTSLRPEGWLTQKIQKEEKPGANFVSSFSVLFLLPLSLSYVNWASQEGCLFYLPLFYFCGFFLFFVF